MGVEISSFGDATHLKSLFTIEKKRRERERKMERVKLRDLPKVAKFIEKLFTIEEVRLGQNNLDG